MLQVHRLYMRYRDYINGIDPVYGIKGYPQNNLFGLRKISDNCFVDKMRYCKKNNDLCVHQSSLLNAWVRQWYLVS